MLDFTVDWRAEVLDLRRRLSLLEGMYYGHTQPQCGEITLIRMYLDAHKALGWQDPVVMRSWVRQIYLLEVKTLVLMGRTLRDPFPWRPFLATLDAYCARGADGAEAAREHLLAVSQDLLVAMGLELVEPRDVMGRLLLNDALKKLAAISL